MPSYELWQDAAGHILANGAMLYCIQARVAERLLKVLDIHGLGFRPGSSLKACMCRPSNCMIWAHSEGALILQLQVTYYHKWLQPLSTDTGVAEHSISTDFSVKMSLDSQSINNIQSLEIVLTINRSNPASLYLQQACNIVPRQESYSRSEENQLPFSIQESEEGNNGTSELVISANK